jgi:hypothetical protein
MTLASGQFSACWQFSKASASANLCLAGTLAELQLVIGAATGLNTTISELPRQPYTVKNALPDNSTSLNLLRRLIRCHKLGHMRCVLDFGNVNGY